MDDPSLVLVCQVGSHLLLSIYVHSNEIGFLIIIFLNTNKIESNGRRRGGQFRQVLVELPVSVSFIERSEHNFVLLLCFLKTTSSGIPPPGSRYRIPRYGEGSMPKLKRSLSLSMRSEPYLTPSPPGPGNTRARGYSNRKSNESFRRGG